MTQDSGVVVTTMEGKEVFVNPNVNTYVVKNIIFYKLNKDGQKVWETEIVKYSSSGSVNHINRMIETSSGNILAAGQFNQLGGRMGSLIKLSSEGDSIWQRFYTYPDKNSYRINDMELLPDGSILLAGENSSPQEGWLLAVDSMGCLIPNCVTSSKEEVELDVPLLRIYPNPVGNLLNIQFRSDREYSEGAFRIFSISGQLMKEWDNSHNDHFIILDVHVYPAGQYFLQYEYEGEMINEAFVKK